MVGSTTKAKFLVASSHISPNTIRLTAAALVAVPPTAVVTTVTLPALMLPVLAEVTVVPPLGRFVVAKEA